MSLSFRRPLVPTFLLVGALALGACGGGGAAGDAIPDATGDTPVATASAGAGALPDPCAMLTEADVTRLTGKAVTQLDRDDTADDNARYCQWQLDGGQLAVTLSPQTADSFGTEHANGTAVSGVGDQAVAADGHLYVLSGATQVDVYVRGADTDDGNLRVASDVANELLPKL